jgi:peptide/nickel transport system substrate-binding protein
MRFTVTTCQISRRALLGSSAALLASGFLPSLASAQATSGGILTTVSWPSPAVLTSAGSTAGAEMFVSAKMFDGLLAYDFDMNPQPSLAEAWEISDNGLRMTFRLRKDVTWHDGQPFTSKDVAYTLMEVWKVRHGRGRSTFATVEAVETPDDHTVVLVLSKPAPAIMKALFAAESAILPAHLYAGKDFVENPHNLQPVGTGPYKFVSFQRGDNLVLEKNPNYWNKDLPRFDRVVMRFVPDAATRSAMIEAGEAQLVPNSLVPAPDIARLRELPTIGVETRGYEHSCGMQMMDFNLDRPQLADVRVRRAIAHAIDKNWVLRNIWLGLGKVATGPIHQDQTAFYSDDNIPAYDYDLDKANALLDEAGFPRGGGGVRFALTINPMPFGDEPLRLAEYIREQCRRIGITVDVRTQDYGAYAKQVYTDRDFDMNIIAASTTADPTIGVQRFYWSKNFIPGTPVSNGSHYSNPKVDELLESAQVEMNPERRRDLFVQFQRAIMEDIPSLPVIAYERATITSAKLHDHTLGGVGPYGNFARAWLEA